MQVKINKLIDTINKEVLCMQNFMTLLTEEQEFLVKGDIKSLQKSVGEQERTILEAEKLERERIRQTDEVALTLKLKKDEVNLSKLVQLVEESYSVQIKELQRTLVHLYEKVERQRRKNEFLIRQSMGMVDRNMKFILGVEDSKPTYTKPNGKTAVAHPRKMVDRLS